jgi:hypothetical protein
MGLIVVAADKGAPGVTTAAVALAAVWPRPVLLAECDPAGGDIVYRLPSADGARLDPHRGLLTLAVATRRGVGPEQVWEHVQKLRGGLDVLVGVTSAEQGMGLDLMWGQVGAALSDLQQADVIADCGRLGADGRHYDLLARADAVVLVTRASLGDMVRLRDRVAVVDAAIRRRGGYPGRVGVVVVADHRHFAAAQAEVRQVLDSGDCQAAVIGGLAYEPKSAQMLSGAWGGKLDRSLLIRTAREVAAKVSAQVAEIRELAPPALSRPAISGPPAPEAAPPPRADPPRAAMPSHPMAAPTQHDPAPRVRALPGPAPDGPPLNGPVRPALNGPPLNGPPLNGPAMNGQPLNGPALNGQPLSRPGLNGSALNQPGLNGWPSQPPDRSAQDRHPQDRHPHDQHGFDPHAQESRGQAGHVPVLLPPAGQLPGPQGPPLRRPPVPDDQAGRRPPAPYEFSPRDALTIPPRDAPLPAMPPDDAVLRALPPRDPRDPRDPREPRDQDDPREPGGQAHFWREPEAAPAGRVRPAGLRGVAPPESDYPTGDYPTGQLPGAPPVQLDPREQARRGRHAGPPAVPAGPATDTGGR